MGSSFDAAQESHKHTCVEVARLEGEVERLQEQKNYYENLFHETCDEVERLEKELHLATCETCI